AIDASSSDDASDTRPLLKRRDQDPDHTAGPQQNIQKDGAASSSWQHDAQMPAGYSQAAAAEASEIDDVP
ncbi:unnamed protein product, partial [Prorocentrum cordatum]